MFRGQLQVLYYACSVIQTDHNQADLCRISSSHLYIGSYLYVSPFLLFQNVKLLLHRDDFFGFLSSETKRCLPLILGGRLLSDFCNTLCFLMQS